MTEKQTVKCQVHKVDMPVSSCLARQEIMHNKPEGGPKLQAYRIYLQSCGKCDLGKELYRESKGETMPGLKTCVKCKRELPADTEHFDVANRAADNLTRACKDCRGEGPSKEKAAKPVVEKRTCKGPCGRTLDLTAENFHKLKSGPGGFYEICKTCRNAAERQRTAAMPKRSRLVQVDLSMLPESSMQELELEARKSFRPVADYIAFRIHGLFSGRQECAEG